MKERRNGVYALWFVLMMLAAGTLHADDRWSITAELAPGESYSKVKWFGIMPVRLVPQIALWIETEDGRFQDTIYATRRNIENDWRGSDDRAEALPVYNGKRGTVDAVGGASPKGKKLVRLEGQMSIPLGRTCSSGK